MTYVSALISARPVKCYDVISSSGEQTTLRQYNVRARHVAGTRTDAQLDNPKCSSD